MNRNNGEQVISKEKLTQAIYLAAIELQRSAHSEKDVIRAFKTQIKKLNLRGGLSLLDETGTHLTVASVEYPDHIKKMIESLGQMAGAQPIGFRIDLNKVEAYRRTIDTKQAVYVKDSSTVIAQMMFGKYYKFTEKAISVLGNVPAIYAPLILAGEIIGVLNIAGNTLTQRDTLLFEVFARHIAVALENARLFTALRESEKRYRLLLEPGLVAVYQTSLDGQVLECNNAFVQLLGYQSREEVLKCNANDFYYSDTDRGAFIALIQEQGTQSLEYLLKRKDGTPVWVLEEVMLLEEEGKPAVIQGAAINITERKQAAQIQSVLLEIAQVAHKTDDLYVILSAIQHHLGKLVDTSNFFIALYDEKTELYSFPFWSGEYDEDFSPQPMKKGLTDYVRCTGKPLIIDRPGLEKLIENGEVILIGKPMAQWLGVPLITHQGVIGVMVTQSYTDPSAYSEKDLDVLTVVSGNIATILQRKYALEALQESEEKFRTLAESSQDYIMRYDKQGRHIYMNPAALEISNFREDEIIGKTHLELGYDEKRSRFLEEKIKQVFKNGKPFEAQFDWENAEGVITLDWRLTPEFDEFGNVKTVLGVSRDITKLRRSELALKEAQLHLYTLIEQAPIGIVTFDLEGNVTDINQKGVEILGSPGREKTVGLNVFKLQPIIDAGLDVLYRKLIKTGEPQEKELQYTSLWGKRTWVHTRLVPYLDAYDKQIGILQIIEDISERKGFEQQLEYLANHDPLTDIPNQRYFNKRLEQALNYARQNKSFGAVIYLDLDDFKSVNDAFGHKVGDDLLKTLAQRIRMTLRGNDIVARMGGDEFAILVEGISKLIDIDTVVTKIQQTINEPFEVHIYRLSISSSLGITIFPDDGKSVSGLIQNASLALHYAKNYIKGDYVYYKQHMSETAYEEVMFRNELSSAIKNDELSLVYQPQIDLDTNQIMGVEALLRWNQPDRGWIPPTRIIELAEKHGLIDSLGKWIFHTACSHLKDLAPIRLSINLSPYQLKQANFLEELKGILRDINFEPDRLELEITEHQDLYSEDSYILFQRLRDLGIKLAVDDFGTGYSSLEYLASFPIDTLKIAQTFIKQAASDPAAISIIKGIVAICSALDLNLVAEGIETERELNIAQRAGCNIIQGYYLARPMPILELINFISQSSYL